MSYNNHAECAVAVHRGLFTVRRVSFSRGRINDGLWATCLLAGKHYKYLHNNNGGSMEITSVWIKMFIIWRNEC